MLFKKLAALGVISLALLMGTLAGCGKFDPILNVNNAPIEGAGSKTMNNVKRAIILAGSRIGWQMQTVSDGHVVATLFRAGHMAKVNINYTSESYSITYKDSSNLEYNGETILGTYNRWVEELHKAIRKNLARM